MGSYALAVNWAYVDYFEIDAMIDPSVYNSDTNVRVYELNGPVVPSATSETMMTSSGSPDKV